MKRLVLAALVGGLGGPFPVALVAQPAQGPYLAELVEVVDGDTLTLRVHIWLGQQVTTSVRLEGIDTPELHGACPEERVRAAAARDALARHAASGPLVVSDVRFDKYGGRVRARVADGEGVDLAARLLAEGHARPYGGGARGIWCG